MQDNNRVLTALNLKEEIQKVEYRLSKINQGKLIAIKIVWKNPNSEDSYSSYSEIDSMPPEMLGMYRDLLKRKLKILKEEYEQV